MSPIFDQEPDELHFPVEAFGNAIVFGEPPHGGDFAPPTVEGFSQSLHRSKLLGFVLLDVGQESGNEFFGPCNRLVLFI